MVISSALDAGRCVPLLFPVRSQRYFIYIYIVFSSSFGKLYAICDVSACLVWLYVHIRGRHIAGPGGGFVSLLGEGGGKCNVTICPEISGTTGCSTRPDEREGRPWL